MGKGHIATLSASRIREAKVEVMLRDPPPRTWAARMPAYCYTKLCPVHSLRAYPAGEGRMIRGGDADGNKDDQETVGRLPETQAGNPSPGAGAGGDEAGG